MKTAYNVLQEAGYSDDEINAGLEYAERVGWKDEDDRGSLALAHILYDETELQVSPRAPWDPTCYSDEAE